jgi:hypothetical protein
MSGSSSLQANACDEGRFAAVPGLRDAVVVGRRKKSEDVGFAGAGGLELGS